MKTIRLKPGWLLELLRIHKYFFFMLVHSGYANACIDTDRSSVTVHSLRLRAGEGGEGSGFKNLPPHPLRLAGGGKAE